MYLPNTDQERRAMLERIGIASIDELFDCIPPELRLSGELNLPGALCELELTRHLAELAGRNAAVEEQLCFLGGGCYDHFIPAVVDIVASRSEFYTAYTPYQAEASQGTLQAAFEFQTMICQLTGLDCANASLYDGATALAEAVFLARSATNRQHKIVVSGVLHPEFRETLATYLKNLGVERVEAPIHNGQTDLAKLAEVVDSQTACIVVQSPNFFGQVERVGPMAQVAQQSGALLVQVYDPISLGVLRRPGDLGADVAVAEGQSLGTPLSYGGPILGLFACRERFVRRIPGRVVGQTLDRHGNRAFVLTLQTREQHIRREKATSNICTNQGLLAVRAAVYLAMVGSKGLREAAELCWHKSHYAAGRLAEVAGVKVLFGNRFIKEFVVELPCKAEPVFDRLAEEGIFAGIALGRWHPHLERCLLVAVTEKRTRSEIDRLADRLRAALR